MTAVLALGLPEPLEPLEPLGQDVPIVAALPPSLRSTGSSSCPSLIPNDQLSRFSFNGQQARTCVQ